MNHRWIFIVAAAAIACRGDSGADASSRSALIQDSLLPNVIVQGEQVATVALAERMAELNVPAVSIAVIDGGRIAWTAAWGMADVESSRPATTTTLFQAASISKPVAATTALALVEEGRLALDEDVNTYLTRWQVPAHAFTAAEPVTLRRLVTHTAGLTVHGFPGYARSADIPDAVAVLDGLGNTDPVRVDTTPGAVWRYSGGGYTVMQVMLSDIAGQPFADLMAARVLGPMGMTSSTYEQPLPESRWPEAATAYRPDGTPVEESWHVYPEQAAAGLWTTPTDLARWGLAILAAYDGEEGGVLSSAMAKKMLTPGMNRHGLGPAIGEGNAWFGHGGSNEGYRCRLVVFFDGRGVAVMTNGDRGGELAQQIMGTLAAAYDWPDFRPVERAVAEVDASVTAALVGTYRVVDRDFDIVISFEGDRLHLTAPGYESELLPESDSVFFTRDDGERFRVIREDGEVVAVEQRERRATRVR